MEDSKLKEGGNDNKQEKVAELMMKNVVDFGKFSFELEEKREQSLINQSSQMITAFSVFTIALYTLLPVLISCLNISIVPKMLFSVGIISTLLLISLLLALLAQWRYKYSTMQIIDEFYNRVYQEHTNYKTQAQFYILWKDQIQDIHKSKKINNDKRVKLVKWSIYVFLISMGTVIVSIIALIFIHL
ncbi:MAG: hypothetical protein LBI42_11700 [Chitinispirillales bacterium]|jgi:hypothetical protein|nr:hypothetical protein [Chitinispirillales bacterium]